MVEVITTARLHMGFFDLNGGLGRRFGSIGLSLDQPATKLQLWRDDQFHAEGDGAERALSEAKSFAAAMGLSSGVGLKLISAIPEHAGLGSGTQMALAVGMGMAKLFDLPESLESVASMTERGARSGIGIGTFALGGLIVDGGRGADTVVPPVISRMAFPEEWCIILIFDKSARGVHGEAEIQAFKTLPQFSSESAAELCRYVLMQALPALAEHNLAAFGEAVFELQARVGDHFALAQGGGRYASRNVTSVLELLGQQGVVCRGQSSWGPTGFAVVENEMHAKHLLEGLESKYIECDDLAFMLCKARNLGAVVTEKMLWKC